MNLGDTYQLCTKRSSSVVSKRQGHDAVTHIRATSQLMVCHVVSASGARLLFSQERVPAGMGAGMVEKQISQRDNTRVTVSDRIVKAQ